ncbi:MAG: DHA2 family efflux MFS transporter permease subunit [Acidobacteria bacterium]|nr:DHA2 family efflux MFS transporter permease subunit [Acidobacteriota bacterium]
MKLELRSRQGLLTLSATILASGMAFLDSTAVNVALPAIAEQLGASFSELQWILDGYLLTLGALILPVGRLADNVGKKRVFTWGVIAFAATSLACGLAPGAVWLIIFRTLQGAAAALVVPTSLALVQASFRSEDRSTAIGFWSGFSGLSTVLGPVVGGWLVDAISWRVVFFLNLPLALVTAFLTRSIPSDEPAKRSAIDYAGAALLIASAGTLLFVLIEGPVQGWTSLPVLSAGVAFLAFLPALIVQQRRRGETRLLPPPIFESRPFIAANLITIVVYGVLGTVFFLLTIQLQNVLGYSAFQAGLATAPVTLLLLILSPLAGRWAGLHGPMIPLIAGPAICAVGTYFMSRVADGDPYVPAVLVPIVVFGIGLGLTVAPLTATALGALDDAHSGLASGANNAVARLAQLIGISVIPLLAGLPAAQHLAPERFSAGFRIAMLVSAGFLLVAPVISATMLRNDGVGSELGT